MMNRDWPNSSIFTRSLKINSSISVHKRRSYSVYLEDTTISKVLTLFKRQLKFCYNLQCIHTLAEMNYLCVLSICSLKINERNKQMYNILLAVFPYVFLFFWFFHLFSDFPQKGIWKLILTYLWHVVHEVIYSPSLGKKF